MKPLWKDIINKSLLLFVARVGAKLATVLVMVILARILGADSFGMLSAILALSLFAGLMSDFGLILPTIRAISGQTGAICEIVQGTFTIRILGATIGMAIVLVGGMWLNLPLHFVLILGLSSVLESLATSVARSFEGRREIHVLTFYVVSERVIFALVVVAAALMFRSIGAVVLAQLVAYSISLSVALFIFARRVGWLKVRFSMEGIQSYVRTGTPLLLTSIVSTLFYRADILLLSHYRSNVEIGFYNAAFRLIDAQMFIPMTIMVSIFPTLSKMHFERNKDFLVVFRKSFLLLSSAGVFVMIILILAGPFLIRLLFTEEYKESIRVLQILAIMLPFYFVNYLLSQSLVAIHQETVFSKIMVVAALLSVCLNVMVVPTYGYIGSAWIRVAGEVIAFVAFSIAFRAKLREMKDGANPLEAGTLAYD
jgi:O-antigen/teichoic acid export membrane protein